MVVVMTPQAKKSKWVRIEVSQAQELDRPIVPLLAAAERKEAILFSLLDVQYLDIRSDYADVVQVSLIPAVQSHLSKRCAEEEKEHGDEEREQAQRLDAHKLKLAHEEQEKKSEALKRWQQFQQYLAQGKIAEAQALRNQLDDDCIAGRLADHERIQATVRDLLALAAGTQMPSKERLLELARQYPQPTAKALACAPLEGKSIAERINGAELINALIEQRIQSPDYWADLVTQELLSQVNRLSVVSGCEQFEYAVPDVRSYLDENVRRFAAQLGGTNPFRYDKAERENFSIWCDLTAYWDQHSANLAVQGSGATVVFGAAGSGKSALACADRARLYNERDRLTGLWVSHRDAWDSASVATVAARELLDFVVKYPCFWPTQPAQQECLAHIWLALIPYDVVRTTTDIASADPLAQSDKRYRAALQAVIRGVQHASAMPPYMLHPDYWPSVLVTAARIVGFEKLRIFVDDLASMPSTKDIDTILRWRDVQIDIILLTERNDIAAVAAENGVRTVTLTWNRQELWKMAFHRLAQFTNPPPDTAGWGPEGGTGDMFQALEADLGGDLASWIDHKAVRQVFHRDGWAAAVGLEQLKTPPRHDALVARVVDSGTRRR